jgi:hypothetical protein
MPTLRSPIVPEALLSILEKRDAYLSPSRFPTHEVQHYVRAGEPPRERKAFVREVRLRKRRQNRRSVAL